MRFILLLLLLIDVQQVYSQSPYELSKSKDAIILGIGIPVAVGGFFLENSVNPLTKKEIDDLKSEDVNRFDFFVTKNFSTKAADWSDILLYACIASPFLLMTSQDVRKDAATFSVMYGQAILFGISLPAIGKGTVQRLRPFVYNPDAPMDIKLKANAKRSFFSGHTSIAFTSMIFLSTVYSDYYPDSKWEPYIWIGSILLASGVGYFRIIAGAHFLTDVLVGAVVGTAVGYFIPRLHRTDNLNDFQQNPGVQTRQPMVSVHFWL